MVITHIDKNKKYYLILLLIFLISISNSIASDYEDCLDDCSDDKNDCFDICEDNYCKPSCGGNYSTCKSTCTLNYNTCNNICQIIDEDGDGVDDYNDTTVGTEDDVIIEGIINLDVFVGNYQSNESNASIVTGIQTVIFQADNNPTLEFDQDFTSSSLNLVDIEIKLQTSGDIHGIIVKGINDSAVPSKTVYLNRRNHEGSICIKDAAIDQITDISNNCQGVDEIFFGKCDLGETIGKYSCSVENGFYKIDGLTHSGAVELNLTGVFSGFFTVNYLNSLNNHRDGYLMPGETISICFESARSLYDDEHMRMVFVPKVGGLTINEFYLPGVINNYNTHIYP
jgi:hypothetical protein